MFFDFFQFDPESSYFYLAVNPAEELDIAIREPPG
jgi:hypothetical protein